MSALDNILFQNKFLAIVDRDGYTFLREVRCDGKIVAMLPFRRLVNQIEFLARLEVCPPHGPELELCSITGGVDPEETVPEAARQELWEEAGYEASEKELVPLGEVRPSKSSDTIVYLFAVDVTEKEQMTAPGDGTAYEAGASVQWVDFDQGLQITDPLFVTAMARLMRWIAKES